MSFLILSPSPSLTDLVERLWLHQGTVTENTMDWVLPCGREEILINLSDGELRCYHDDGRANGRTLGPILAGLHRSSYLIDTRQQSTIMGVHFKPGGIWRLLGIPASELAGSRLAMEILIGVGTRQLMDRLWQSKDSVQRLRIMDQTLADCYQKAPKKLHPAVAWAAAQIFHYPERIRIDGLAEEAGLSLRRFSEVFTRQIGLNPKTFARLKRFETALNRIHGSPGPIWSDFAVATGYSDQAHLIRDFREFSGLTPAAYHAQRGPFPHLVRRSEAPSDFFNTQKDFSTNLAEVL